jgi:hypothetical protein
MNGADIKNEETMPNTDFIEFENSQNQENLDDCEDLNLRSNEEKESYHFCESSQKLPSSPSSESQNFLLVPGGYNILPNEEMILQNQPFPRTQEYFSQEEDDQYTTLNYKQEMLETKLSLLNEDLDKILVLTTGNQSVIDNHMFKTIMRLIITTDDTDTHEKSLDLTSNILKNISVILKTTDPNIRL